MASTTDNRNKSNTFQSSKTLCPRGHEYTPENTRQIPSTKPGHFKRQCLTCKKMRARGEIQTVKPRKRASQPTNDLASTP